MSTKRTEPPEQKDNDTQSTTGDEELLELEDAGGSAKIVKKKTRRKQSVSKKPVTLGQVVSEKTKAKAVQPSLLLFTLYYVYKILYILGISLMRSSRRSYKKLHLCLSKIKGSFYALVYKASLAIKRIWRNFINKIRAPFQRIGEVYSQQKPLIEQSKSSGKFKINLYFPIVEVVGRLLFKILLTIFNYVAPVVAAVFLITHISSELTRPVALKLEYGDHKMGYVENESTFDAAVKIVQERLYDQTAQQFAIGLPSFSIEEEEVSQFLDSSELADMIMRIHNIDIKEAYGLYIGGAFLGATTDKDSVLNELDSIKAESATGKRDERVEFLKKIVLKPALYPTGSIVETQTILDKINSAEETGDTYTVREGDTPSEIADKNGMTYSSLLQLNPTIEENLMPGMELTTRAEKPFLSVKNIFIDTYEEEIEFETIEVENSVYATSYREVEVEGENGLREVTAEITMVNGVETNRTIIGTPKIIRKAVDEKVVVGTNTATMQSGSTGTDTAPVRTDQTPSAQTGQFIWPTVSGRATTYHNHTGNGVDIAPGGAGHPIYAAASGTVVKVVNGWTGYGHHIIIDHGNGYQTLYAHHSANYVSVGDYVSQGQVIAAMGRTGWATGNHLHFEIRYQGRYMNPPDYIGYSH